MGDAIRLARTRMGSSFARFIHWPPQDGLTLRFAEENLFVPGGRSGTRLLMERLSGPACRRVVPQWYDALKRGTIKNKRLLAGLVLRFFVDCILSSKGCQRAAFLVRGSAAVMRHWYLCDQSTACRTIASDNPSCRECEALAGRYLPHLACKRCVLS